MTRKRDAALLVSAMLDALQQDLEEPTEMSPQGNDDDTKGGGEEAVRVDEGAITHIPLLPFIGDENVVPDLLSLFHFFKSMSHILRLSPFPPEPFLAAMCITDTSPMIDEIFTALLRYLHLCANSGNASFFKFSPFPFTTVTLDP